MRVPVLHIRRYVRVRADLIFEAIRYVTAGKELTQPLCMYDCNPRKDYFITQLYSGQPYPARAPFLVVGKVDTFLERKMQLISRSVAVVVVIEAAIDIFNGERDCWRRKQLKTVLEQRRALTIRRCKHQLCRTGTQNKINKKRSPPERTV